jgi:hypothetical protein
VGAVAGHSLLSQVARCSGSSAFCVLVTSIIDTIVYPGRVPGGTATTVWLEDRRELRDAFLGRFLALRTRPRRGGGPRRVRRAIGAGGRGREERAVGKGTAHLFDARALVEQAVGRIERNFASGASADRKQQVISPPLGLPLYAGHFVLG